MCKRLLNDDDDDDDEDKRETKEKKRGKTKRTPSSSRRIGDDAIFDFKRCFGRYLLRVQYTSLSCDAFLN